MVGAHPNLNGSHDLTTPLSVTICHLCDKACYHQLAYQIGSLYPYSLRGHEKGYKMWKIRWFGVVRYHLKSVEIAPFDIAHTSSY